MELKVNHYYVTRNLEIVHIVGISRSGSVEIFHDDYGRMYFIDGVPTSGGVGDGFRIVAELARDRKELEDQFKDLSGTLILNKGFD